MEGGDIIMDGTAAAAGGVDVSRLSVPAAGVESNSASGSSAAPVDEAGAPEALDGAGALPDWAAGLSSIVAEKVTEGTALSVLGSLAAEAAGLGTCARCLARYLGVRTAALYRVTLQELTSVLSAVLKTELTTATSSVCVCCLGMLQGDLTAPDSVVPEKIDQALLPAMHVVQAVVAALRAGSYEMKAYVINMCVPGSVHLRQHAMWVHLGRKFPRVLPPLNRIMDLKDVIKEWLYPALLNTFGIYFGAGSDITIDLLYIHDQAMWEVEQLLGQGAAVINKKRHRRGHGRPVAKDTLAGSSQAHVSASGAVVAALARAGFMLPRTVQCPPVAGSACKLQISLNRYPHYLKGHYLKFSRYLSQTPWLIDGARRSSTSVEEVIANAIVPFYGASSYKFHTAGREDVDVRMLGDGRAFVLELVDAKKDPARVTAAELQMLTDKVNASSEDVEVRHLDRAPKSYILALARGADSKRKTYACVVWASKKITPESLAVLNRTDKFAVNQSTPVRVVHRRSLLVRKKVIHSMSTEYINSHFFVLRLVTSAGTYVKEFVHGDLGRTEPSVSSLLGCTADILQLDVEGLIYEDEAVGADGDDDGDRDSDVSGGGASGSGSEDGSSDDNA